MKVSVVVPVYNAGRYLEACVGSLLGQTMDPAEHEVIFVDDGSTDGSGDLLDEAAAGRGNVHVIHIGNTGGPGGPRNLGLDTARGDYVYFLDSDDWLGPEALERMHAMAERNDSDIVIGRLVGQGRGVPRWIFRENRDRADILRHRLLHMLTPHKLFRVAMLREHGIRFPEGPVRLEDHRFCVPAYFKAKVISVLADYACCHWVKRDDGANYSTKRFDPRHYFAAVAEVLDVVDAHVEPGPERDRFYAHWLRGKMLKRLGAGTLLSYPPGYRRELFAAIRDLTLDRFPVEVERWIPRNMRPRAALVRADALHDLIRLAGAERGITVRPVVRTLGWEGDTLVVGVSTPFVYRDGRPVCFRRESHPGKERMLWEPPVALSTPVPAEALDVTEALPRSRLDLLARNRDTGEEVMVPTSYACELSAGDLVCVTLTGEARLHVPTALHGGPLEPGTWDLSVRADVCGWAPERRVGADRTPEAEAACVGGFAGGRLVVPCWTRNGNLSVRVDPRSAPDITAAAATAAVVQTSPRRIWLTVPVPYVPRERVAVRLSRGTREVRVVATYLPASPGSAPYGPARHGEPHGRLMAVIPRGRGRRRVGAGTWNVDLLGPERTVRLGVRLTVEGRGGEARAVPTRPEPPADPVPASAPRRLARRVPGLRRAVRWARGLRGGWSSRGRRGRRRVARR